MFLRGFVTCAMFLIAGCAGPADEWAKKRPAVVPVSGQVLFQGKPVEEASISFSQVDGSYGANARTGGDGRFRLTTFKPNDGAVPGQYRVRVIKDIILSQGTVPPGQDVATEVTIERMLPDKYRNFDTSGITKEVTASGPNELIVELIR